MEHRGVIAPASPVGAYAQLLPRRVLPGTPSQCEGDFFSPSCQEGEFWFAFDKNFVSIHSMSLPFNKSLTERARELRKNSTLSEILFWNMVKNKQFDGLDFNRQKVIGNYIVDFYCARLGVVIEIDGWTHDNKQAYDAKRDEYLRLLGLYVLHIYDEDVKHDINGTMQMVKEFCSKIPTKY